MVEVEPVALPLQKIMFAQCKAFLLVLAFLPEKMMLQNSHRILSGLRIQTGRTLC